MAYPEKWGEGDESKWHYFEEGRFQTGRPFRLFFGEHPHSRRDNDIYANLAEEGEKPRVVGFDGHRIRRKIIIEEANYLKTSELSGNEIRKQCWADIYFNDQLVYRVTGPREADHMMHVVERKMDELINLPVSIWKPEFSELIGRKVYYSEVPCVVKRYVPERGAAVFVAESGHKFHKAPWQNGDDGWFDGDFDEKEVFDDILSEHIWWFRK